MNEWFAWMIAWMICNQIKKTNFSNALIPLLIMQQVFEIYFLILILIWLSLISFHIIFPVISSNMFYNICSRLFHWCKKWPIFLNLLVNAASLACLMTWQNKGNCVFPHVKKHLSIAIINKLFSETFENFPAKWLQASPHSLQS